MKTPTSICQFIYDQIQVDYEMWSELQDDMIIMRASIGEEEDVTLRVVIEPDDTTHTVTRKLNEQYSLARSNIYQQNRDYEHASVTQGYPFDKLTF